MDNDTRNSELEYKNESSFLQLARKVLSHTFSSKVGRLSSSKVRKYSSVCFFFIACIISISVSKLLIESNSTLTIIEKISSTVLMVSTTLLGFLITGFSVYTAIADKDLVYLLMNYRVQDKSQFHTNNLTFFEPFLVLFITLCLSSVLYIVTLLWQQIMTYIWFINPWWLIALLAIYFIVVYISMISVKDFIYNIYAVAIMMGIFESQKEHDQSIKEIAEKLRNL